jgi:hypothetical protein
MVLYLQKRKVYFISRIYNNKDKSKLKNLEFYMESGCKHRYPFELVPFAFRTHAHSLGKVISAYLVKENKKIYEIGRMSPQQPQVNYSFFYLQKLIKLFIKIKLLYRCFIMSQRQTWLSIKMIYLFQNVQ